MVLLTTKVMVNTMQAISGAGYPGVPSLDILSNVIPFIQGEENKLEVEPLKILGNVADGKIQSLTDCVISASCTRVPVKEGHTINVSVKFSDPARAPRSVADLVQAMTEYSVEPELAQLGEEALHIRAKSLLFPNTPIVVLDASDRPQPILDVDNGQGMACTVGRIRPCPILDFKFTVLSHNTVLGAAGSSLLNAEIAHLVQLL